MNQPFMFNQGFGPYTDNPKFIKKCVSPTILLICTICIGLMLTGAFYFTFVSSSSESFSADAYEAVTNEAVVFIQTFGYGILDCFLILPFIGFISMLISSKNKDSSSIGIGPGIMSVFLILSIVFFSFMLLGELSEISDLIKLFTKKSNEDTEKQIMSICSFCISFLPTAAGLFWAISGLVFTASVKKTAKCTGIFTSGGRMFSLLSKILAFVNVGLIILYYVNHVNDGFLIGKDPKGMAGIFTYAVNSGIVQASLFTLFLLSNAVMLFCTGITAARYTLISDSARRSIKTSGSNLYMDNDSSATKFYQSAYTSPQQDTPPQNTSDTTQNTAPTTDQPPQPVSHDIRIDEAVFPTVSICPLCGKENPSDGSFCINCGNKLNT